MKNMIASVVAAASICAAPTALAETWSPTGNGVTGPDPFEVRQHFTVICELDAATSANGSSLQITSLNISAGSFGSTLFCPNFYFSGLPYNVEPDPATSLTSVVIHGVLFQGFSGTCAGNLKADFDQSTGELTFSHVNTLPPISGAIPCSFEGIVTTTPALSYTVP